MIRKYHWKTAAASSSYEHIHRYSPRRRICAGITAALLGAAVFLAGCGGDAAASGSTGASGEEAAVRTTTIPDAQQLARLVIDQSETVSSAEMDSTVRMHMSIKAGEEEQGFGGEMKSYIRTILEPLTIHMVSVSDLTAEEAAPAGGTGEEEAPAGGTNGGEAPTGGTGGDESPLNMETYGEMTENGRFATYTKTGGTDSWSKTVVAVPESSSDIFNIELLQSIVSGETEASVSPATDFVDGKECYVLNTFLSGELAQSSLETASAILSEIGLSLQDLPEDLLKDTKVKTVIWVDLETGLPTKIEQDLAELGNTLFNELFKSLLSSYESSGESSTGAAQEMPAFAFHFSEYSSEIIFRSFNTVPEIIIPKEARDAEEISLTPGTGAP